MVFRMAVAQAGLQLYLEILKKQADSRKYNSYNHNFITHGLVGELLICVLQFLQHPSPLNQDILEVIASIKK